MAVKRSGKKRNEEKGREGKEREEIREILEDREHCGYYGDGSDGYLGTRGTRKFFSFMYIRMPISPICSRIELRWRYPPSDIRAPSAHRVNRGFRSTINTVMAVSVNGSIV